MMTNFSLLSNESSSFPDISFSTLSNDSNSFTFDIPPPPHGPGKPSSTKFEILNSALYNALTRWVLEKIQSYINSISLKNPLNLFENKTFLMEPLQAIISDIFAVYPLFGANIMTFEPMGRFEDIQFNLSEPDINDKRKLTVKWGNRTVTYDCPLVDDSSKAFSSMVEHSQYGAEKADECVHLTLRPGLTAYIINPKTDIDAKNLLNRLVCYSNMAKELDEWCSEKSIDETQKIRRQEAKNRILNCYEGSKSSLDLSLLSLSSLPNCVGNLADLTTLNLEDNRLKSLPESLIQLNNLTTLNLQDNFLTSLPEIVSQLNALTTLNLYQNRLTSLPESIGNLKALRALKLDSNKLTFLPDSIDNLTALTTLNLNSNLFRSLPESIGNLTALTELDVTFNHLTFLPVSIWNLTGLTTLNLDYNLFTSLPESIGKLTALRTLNLYRNRLTSLPESIQNLQNLHFFYSSDNPYRSLPQSILQLPSDVDINLSGHNLSERTIQNLRHLINQRNSQGLQTPRFVFDMPPPRDSLDPMTLKQSLTQLLKFSDYKTINFDITHFSTVDHPSRLWLHNLLQTSDFIQGSSELKKQLAKVVLNVFKYAAEHDDFRGSFEEFLTEANVSCVDRVTLSVIELEMLVQLKELSSIKDHQPAQVVQLLRNVWATHLLHGIAKRKVASSPLVDELDVHLGFLIPCKRLLKAQGIELPFTSEHMLFLGITGIEEEELEQAANDVEQIMKSQNANKELVEFLFLETDLEKVKAKACLALFRATFAKQVQEISNKKYQLLEKITSDTELHSQQVQDQIKDLNKDEKEEYVKILNNF